MVCDLQFTGRRFKLGAMHGPTSHGLGWHTPSYVSSTEMQLGRAAPIPFSMITETHSCLCGNEHCATNYNDVKVVDCAQFGQDARSGRLCM